MTRRICVFCGSSVGARASYAAAAASFGAALARRGYGLVYGGAKVGLMGCVADAALSAGAEVIGVLPRFLGAKEIAHAGLTELKLVDSMHERKALMAELASGFVALPGGFGTLEELFEALTWAQLGLHSKPCGVLDVDGFFDGLLAYADRAAAHGFIRPDHRRLLLVQTEPDALLDAMEAFEPPRVEKWIKKSQT